MKKSKASLNLTAAHLQQLKTVLQGVRPLIADWRDSHRQLPKKGGEMLFGADVWWAWCYELTINQHIDLFFHVFGLSDPLSTALEKAPDRNQAVLDFEKNYEPDAKTLRQRFGPKSNKARKGVLVALSIALTRQLECLEREGCYLSDLVEKVRRGEEEAFFKALHIDRTVVSCPTFGAMISRAELEDKKLFFNNLGKAVEKRWGKTSPQKKPEHKDLRVMLQATDEAGQLKKMSMTEKEKLFIDELGLFKDESGEKDYADSLHRFISRWIFNK